MQTKKTFRRPVPPPLLNFKGFTSLVTYFPNDPEIQRLDKLNIADRLPALPPIVNAPTITIPNGTVGRDAPLIGHAEFHTTSQIEAQSVCPLAAPPLMMLVAFVAPLIAERATNLSAQRIDLRASVT